MIMCYLDCETTGLDPYSDRIVEIALVRVDDEGNDTEKFATRVNPGRPIPASVTVIHGISDEDVAESPIFSAIADEVQRFVTDAVLVGYNSRSFDVPLLHAELQRADRPGFPVDEYGSIAVPEIDLLRVWKASEARDLTTAAKRFGGGHQLDPHHAVADADILPHILTGMRGEFDLDPEGMSLLTVPDDSVDRDGKFRKNGEGKMVFAFGKHMGKPVSRNMAYIDWMLSADFSPETKAWCRRFKAWSNGG